MKIYKPQDNFIEMNIAIQQQEMDITTTEPEEIFMSVQEQQQNINIDLLAESPIKMDYTELDENIDIFFKDIIKVPSGGGGVHIYSAKEELPLQGNKSFLYIVRGYGTFYWDILTNRYESIPIYSGDIEKIFITADQHRILTKDNYIFKPIM